jgi:hypothetical protein
VQMEGLTPDGLPLLLTQQHRSLLPLQHPS